MATRFPSDRVPSQWPLSILFGPRTPQEGQCPARSLPPHESGLWAVRFTCGAGHIHEERVGTVKSEAIQRYHERRGRALSEPAGARGQSAMPRGRPGDLSPTRRTTKSGRAMRIGHSAVHNRSCDG